MHEPHGPIDLADPVDRSHPLNRGRVAWWLAVPGLEGGRQWFDLMGLNHGTLSGFGARAWGGTTRPGGRGQVACDGAGQVSTPLLPTKSYTISLWFRVYPGASGETPGTLICSNDASQYLLFDFDRATSKIQLFLVDGPGGIAYGPALAAGTWHQAAITRRGDAAAGGYQFYVDGAVVGSSNTGTFNPAAALTIGFRPGNTQGHKDALDDVTVYDRALSAAEVGSLCDLSARGYPGVLRRLGSRAWRSAPSGIGPPAASYYQRRRRGA
jgi:hypothetical protein